MTLIVLAVSHSVSAQINCAEQPRECERVILSGNKYVTTLEQSVELERSARLKSEERANKEMERADTERKRADTLERANTTLESAFATQRESTTAYKELVALKDKEIAFQTTRANEFALKYEKQKKKTLVARVATIALTAALYVVLK